MSRNDENIPLFTFSYNEGRIFDFWLFAHLVTGATLGIILLLLGVSIQTAVVSGLVILILWEIFEMLMKINEAPENQVIDIVVGFLGLYTAFIYAEKLTDEQRLWGFLIVAAIAIFLNTSGWIAFRKRKKSRGR